jgi:mRNA-degrading endonuclease RelE of RelBE toxin-antitoxin system
MAASRFVEVTDKEISEIKINSVPENTKDLCKNTKTIIRLRLGDYRGIFTSISSRRIFPKIVTSPSANNC